METAKVICLYGDSKNPEPAEHIIKFPGGSISLCRTTNDEYWAHIEVHDKTPVDYGCRETKRGTIVDARIDNNFNDSELSQKLLNIKATHIAVRIKTEKEGELANV